MEHDDKPLLTAAFEELSDESRYRRFFTPVRSLDAPQLAYLTEVDHHDHEALLAIDMDTGSCSGVARFVRIGDDVAEAAVVVVDRYQRRGLGTELLERLATRARQEGVTRFYAVVLAENREAVALLENLGNVTRGREGEVLRFDIALPETGAGPTLRGLLRAAAAGLLALAHRGWTYDA
ncbi:MAG: GNAT family N-acetyltransferase [Solirubrobacterales bacterium]|nr:GNAT family N-acetyltransferase [Solirubrobacterales bacterium]